MLTILELHREILFYHFTDASPDQILTVVGSTVPLSHNHKIAEVAVSSTCLRMYNYRCIITGVINFGLHEWVRSGRPIITGARMKKKVIFENKKLD